MMNLLDYAQFGVAVFAVATLGYVVVKFLENQRERDSKFIGFMERQESSFKNTIDNHLDAQKKAMENLTVVTDQQNKINQQMLEYLKRCNEEKR